MRRDFLTVRDLEEYFYCPRMFYLKHVLGMRRPVGLWSGLGMEVQEELARYIEENYRVVRREALIEDVELGVRGRVDYVVEDPPGLAPLEVKYSRRIKPWWRYTIVLYALLLEASMGKPVKRGYIVFPGPRVRVVEIYDSDRGYVVDSVKKCRRILGGEAVPRPYVSNSCINCDYRVVCYR